VVSSINKTERHDLTEILLEVALNTINHNQTLTTTQQFNSPTCHHQHQLNMTLKLTIQKKNVTSKINKYEQNKIMDN
jgi:hypothetical protein